MTTTTGNKITAQYIARCWDNTVRIEDGIKKDRATLAAYTRELLGLGKTPVENEVVQGMVWEKFATEFKAEYRLAYANRKVEDKAKRIAELTAMAGKIKNKDAKTVELDRIAELEKIPAWTEANALNAARVALSTLKFKAEIKVAEPAPVSPAATPTDKAPATTPTPKRGRSKTTYTCPCCSAKLQVINKALTEIKAEGAAEGAA
jgi:hypothetical protein